MDCITLAYDLARAAGPLIEMGVIAYEHNVPLLDTIEAAPS